MKPRGPTRARKHGPPESHGLVMLGGAGPRDERDARRRWTEVRETAGDPAEMRRILDLPAGLPLRVQDLPTEIIYDAEGSGNPVELRRREMSAYLVRVEPISPAGG